MRAFQSPLARQYILLTVAFATCLSLLITISEAVSVYVEQRDNIVEIHHEIANLAVSTMAQAIWEFNSEIVETTLHSIVANGGVDFIQLSSENYNFSMGAPKEYSISSLFDVSLIFKGTPQLLGNIEFKTSLSSVFKTVIETALIRLLINFTKTTAVVIFSMFVFHHLVNKHLVMFADYFKNHGAINPGMPKLEIKRNYSENHLNDELDELAQAFNSARAELAVRSKQREYALREVRALEETHRQQLHRIDSLMRNVRQCVSFFSNDGSLAFSSITNSFKDPSAEKMLLQSFINEQQTITLAESLGVNANLVSVSQTQDNSDIFQFELDDHKKKWTFCIVIGSDGAQAMLLSDITEISRQKQIFMASKKVAAIGTIAASVAHELNNGLAVMKGRTELLSQWTQLHFEKKPSKHEDNKQLVDSIAEINNEINHLTATSRMILGFSNNSEKSDAAFHHLNKLGSLVEQAMADFVSDSKTTQVSVQVDGFISVDLTQFLSSLRNLIKNSNEATEPGELIEVKFRVSTANEILEADLNENENFVAIDILDEGSGMGEEMQGHLFSPFFSTKTDGRGTGLGLWYVYNVIANYDGKIIYRPNTPKGSWFTIYLPVSYRTDDVSWKPSNHEDTCSHTVIPTKASGGRIIVVEDNQSMVAIVESYLGHHGYSVVSCHSVADAIFLLDGSDNFDGLITDLNLPDGLGTAVLRHYELINGRGPKVLMTGSLRLEGEESKILDKAIVLSKPFTLSALSEIFSNSSANNNINTKAAMEA